MGALMHLDQVTVRQGIRQFGPLPLSVRAGERVAVLGPSGAGKSTLLRLMAGELKPVGGQLRFQGRPMADWSAAELARRRAVLPQSHGVAFGLPVELVVSLGRVALRSDPRQRQVVQQALACAEALHLMGRRFDTLSGGEQARVQLARVFAQLWDERDGLLLFDEPVAALDPGLVLSLMQAMDAYAAARGHAVVAVLHDLNLALNHFERLWLIQEGRVLVDCGAVPAVLPLLEQLYGLRLRLLRDAHGMAVLPAQDSRPAASYASAP